MEERQAGLENVISPQALLGYLNFSEGKADARFQKQVSDAYRYLSEQGSTAPWRDLEAVLRRELAQLRNTGPFRDATQVEAVLTLVFNRTLPAYRVHHADLLFHLSEQEMYAPYFLTRVCEAVLAQGGPWHEEERVVRAALAQLNDFVGHRPVAILESRPQGEPYDHERVRPIPLFIRGAGVAQGRYHDLITQALDILQAADPTFLADAYFDLRLLDELALDPRAYDHGHPVNRRPNYVFGEWDPHHLDHQGRFRRFVVRQVTLDALLDRVVRPGDLDGVELLYEAAAVLAGTMLMASGVSGSSPTTHDSAATLFKLRERIARYRDAFYTSLLQTRGGTHGRRLVQEMSSTRQAFGAARQHLNHYLARHRAAQLQQRHLALLFAEMGYPEASRRQAAQIPTASIRLLSEIQCRLTTGQLLADRGEPAAAARLLPEVEDLLRRGIAAGALADPWNILGFQGLFPLFVSQEDSIRDPRVDDLVDVMAELFRLYARLLSESAGTGERTLVHTLKPDLRRLGAWWDTFATVEVGDVRRVHGGEALASAEHVADALALWHERGQASADLAFWKQHLQRFHSPKAFALVVEALLRKADYQAAMALLVTWLSQAEQVPLEDGDFSFHDLALRWLLGVASGGGERWPLVKKFFDYLEANADDYWHVPELHQDDAGESEDEEESLYGAAYEDVTYKDSTDDDVEGAVAEGAGAPHEEFSLEEEGEHLGARLRFLAGVARLWQIAAQKHAGAALPEARADLRSWLRIAQHRQKKLLALLDALQACRVPEPIGAYEALVEYDRRRVLKEQLLYHAIGTCLDNFLALGTLRTASGAEAEAEESPPWGELGGRLEQALLQGDAAAAREVLPAFLERFRGEPLLFTALADGGEPRQILRVRIAQTILRALAASLPRLGMVRETYHLLKTARAMEQAQPPRGRGVTQFNELFQTAYQSVVEAVVEAAPRWGPPAQWSVSAAGSYAPSPLDRPLADLLEKLTTPFLKLWIEHGRSLQLSTFESFQGDKDFGELKAFVQRYGRDLFPPRFMTLANLRGLLHRGAGAYLDFLEENRDPLHPVRLLADLDHSIPRAQAVQHLEHVLQAVVENYEEYKDYNTSVAQSDFGDNLYMLLDFLRLKASYERHAWHLRPLLLTHEVLVRKNQYGAAALWREAFAAYNRDAAERILVELARLEQIHGIHLATIADRLQERFVKPLDLDRLCARIKPAMDEAHAAAQPAFALLEQELLPYGAQPTGVGLDVPHWLRRLEQEAQRVWSTRSAIAVLAENAFRMPRQLLAFDDLQRQLSDWERPIG